MSLGVFLPTLPDCQPLGAELCEREEGWALRVHVLEVSFPSPSMGLGFLFVCIRVCVCPCVLLCVTRTWVCKPVYTCRSQNKSPVQSALRQDLPWPRVLGEADCPVSSQDWFVFALQCWSHGHSEHAAFLTWWPRNSDSGRHAFRVFFFSEPVLGLSSQCHHTQFRGPFFPKNNCCWLCWVRGRETGKERATCFLNISGR